ncbi:hypothetical protein GGR56DRAFT_663748 [Xylariaceae sp. FL0804]|nr:hypothetical protein GGR56DRAFT_663748 [Xylariaceae sp. FL0804]
MHARTDCNNTLGDSQCTCQMLSQAINGLNATLFPSDGTAYDDSEDINYSAACRLPAACIVNPSSAEEVSSAMKILVQQQTTFAVRSGGHNYIPGFASVNDTGVLISLSDLDSVELAEDQTSVNVGPGSRWEDVYEAIVPEGLIAVGGRVGPVGIGGLMLGGGMFYFSDEYGLAADNVKSYEVVLANGSIVTAAAENDYSDLYKALRGGGPNFGIVTNYELYTHSVGDMYIDARSYGSNMTTEFFEALAEYQSKGQLDSKSSVTIQVLSTGANLLMLYNEPAQSPAAFDAFYALESYTPILAATNGSFLEVLAISDAQFVTGDIRVYGETFSHKPDADLFNELYDIWQNETASLPSDATGTWVPNPVAASVATIGQQYGGNVLGLEETAQSWYEWFITYEDASEDETIYAISERITQRLTAACEAKGLDVPYLFMNTAGEEQDVLASYGAENVAYIKEVAAKFDPDQVFQKLQHDGFLIRNTS